MAIKFACCPLLCFQSANIILRGGYTVCEMDGNTLYEMDLDTLSSKTLNMLNVANVNLHV